MGVTGHWRRSALGAGGVALLLPLGLALGVALTTAFGGRDGLHALAQVFSGPSTPASAGLSAAPGLESARDVPPIPLPHRRSATPAAPAQRSPAGASAPAREPQRTPSQNSTGGGTKPSHGGSGGGKPPSSSSSPPPQQQPSPPQHSAVHDTGQQAADQVKALPAPAGPAAGSAAQTVVDLSP